MIICSCAVITSEDIDRAVGWMRSSDPAVRVTPGKIYRTLGKEPDCGCWLDRMIERACPTDLSIADPSVESEQVSMPIPRFKAI